MNMHPWLLLPVIPGPRFNIKTVFPRYGDSHVKDKTVARPSLKFVPKGLIDNNPALVEIMAWRRIGDKPLSEPMLTWSADAYAALGGDELIKCWSKDFVKGTHFTPVLEFVFWELTVMGTNGPDIFDKLYSGGITFRFPLVIFPKTAYCCLWGQKYL